MALSGCQKAGQKLNPQKILVKYTDSQDNIFRTDMIIHGYQKAIEKSNSGKILVKYTDSQNNIFRADTILVRYGEGTVESYPAYYHDYTPQAIDFYWAGGRDSLFIEHINYNKHVIRIDTIYFRRYKQL